MVVYFIKPDTGFYVDSEPRFNIFKSDELPFKKIASDTYLVLPEPKLEFIAYTRSEEIARNIVRLLVDEQKQTCVCTPGIAHDCTWDAISEFEIK